MKIPSTLGRGVDSSLPLETVAANPQLSDAEKLGEASRQFEAIFLRQILAAAQKPAFPSRFSSQSFSSGIYQDMMTNQLADKISRSGAFGLAGPLQAQLTRQLTHQTVEDPELEAASSQSAPALPQTSLKQL
jgi:flagellar protein FlgJ